MKACPVCESELSTGLRSWHRVCASCGYEGSELQIDILGQQPGGDLDEKAREVALGALRRSNFRHLLAEIGRLISRRSSVSGKPRLLDVGSAHGWFLELAQKQYEVVGIEPDKGMMATVAAKGLAIREGFFPGALAVDERFDVIVFNDVLEHIPDVGATLESCENHLKPDGLLVVNAPNRGGFMYWMSRQLLRFGYPGTFERLWQCGFPSPHIHYFDSASIEKLGVQHGFSLCQARRLPSVSVAGLYSRVRYSKDVSPFKATLLTIAVAIAIPVLAVLPPDIKVWIFRRE